jgi:phospholipase/carboxylesterase
MPSWFDLFGLSENDKEDVESMMSSAAYLSSLVQKEIDNGILPERIAVAGFSQGE